MILAIIAASAALAAAEGAPDKPPVPSKGFRVDDLVATGFKVVSDTKVIGDFDGCDRGRKVQLASGGVFTCSGFGYMHATSPKAVLLKSPDGRQYKLVVGSAVFDGGYP